MSARDQALEALLTELERLRAAGEEAPPTADLAARFGLGEGAVRDVVAGLHALDQAAASDDPAGPPPDLGADYELQEELGRGGMGVVYRARQRSLGRDVAVKVLRPGQLLFGEALERFDRETRALARLRHPGIAAIHEVGRTDGELYFTMDLIEGGTLADLLRRQKRPLPLAFAVALLRKVAGAIGFVHRHGLVHRDLKPANVLLDADQEPYVVDFGLAVDAAGGHTLTATGRLLGTPAYMAPEQARGERALVTERTDIYALGVMLYELVCGAPPFQRGSLVDTVHAVVHDEPRAPRRLRRDVPRALENVILKAMAKDPAERYGTAEALAEDLRRFSVGEPIEAGAPSLWSVARRGLARHGRLVTGAALGAAAALAVLLPSSDGVLVESAAERLALVRRLQGAGEQRGAGAVARAAWEPLRGHDELAGSEAALAFEALVGRVMELDARHGADAIPATALEELAVDLAWFRGAGGGPNAADALDHLLAERRVGMERLWELEPPESRHIPDPGPGPRGPEWSAAEGHPLEGLLALRRARGEPDWLLEAVDLADAGRMLSLLVERAAAGARLGQVATYLNLAMEPRLGFDVRPTGPTVARLRRLAEDPEAPARRRVEAVSTYLVLQGLPSPHTFATLPEGAPRTPEDRDVTMGRDEFLELAPVRDALRGFEGIDGRDPAVLRRRQGEVLVQLLTAMEASPRAEFWGEVDRWFLRRWGRGLPDDPAALPAWWAAARDAGPRSALEAALGTSPTTVASALAVLHGPGTPMRRRWAHEWLVLETGLPPHAVPWWPVSTGVADAPRADEAAAVAPLWDQALDASGSVPVARLELAVVHWPGGLGAPRVVSTHALDTRELPAASSFRSVEIDPGPPTDVEPAWRSGAGRAPRPDVRDAFGLPIAVGPDDVVLTVRAQRGEGPWRARVQVFADAAMGSGRSPFQRVSRGTLLPPLAAGEVRVIADLVAPELGERGERLAILARGMAADARQDLDGVEAWATALAESLRASAAGAGGADEGAVEVADLECLARLAHDLRAADLDAGARALLETLEDAWNEKGRHRNLKTHLAAEALQLALGEGPGGPILGPYERRRPGSDGLLLAERLALDPDPDVARSARDGLARGLRDGTLEELEVIQESGAIWTRPRSRLRARDARTWRRRVRLAFLGISTLLLLGTALPRRRRPSVRKLGVIWASAALVLLVGTTMELGDGLLVLLPLVGFLCARAAERAQLSSGAAVLFAAAAAAACAAATSQGRATWDALSLGLAASGAMVHAVQARTAAGRGGWLAGGRTAALLALAFALPASTSLLVALGVHQPVLGPGGWISPAVMQGALYGLTALLVRDLIAPRPRPVVPPRRRRRWKRRPRILRLGTAAAGGPAGTEEGL